MPRAATQRKTLRALEDEFKIPVGTSFKMWAYYLAKKDIEEWPDFPERYVQPSQDWKWEQFVLDDMIAEFRLDHGVSGRWWEEYRHLAHKMLAERKHTANWKGKGTAAV